MLRWFRAHWDEEDIWFYFEVDTEGWVIRQIELRGPEWVPIGAASLAEWQKAQKAGKLSRYEATYGMTAEAPVHEWEGYDPQPLTLSDFESVWQQARRHLELTR
ncbi:hypothetical protein ACGFJC_19670 [Nonomuraea fuscirosea]|uniref:hypothetical protein n=1 Tax=Nonomuraea fuscirosea TaxID=1291556 RepID=UPI00371495A7